MRHPRNKNRAGMRWIGSRVGACSSSFYPLLNAGELLTALQIRDSLSQILLKKHWDFLKHTGRWMAAGKSVEDIEEVINLDKLHFVLSAFRRELTQIPTNRLAIENHVRTIFFLYSLSRNK